MLIDFLNSFLFLLNLYIIYGEKHVLHAEKSVIRPGDGGRIPSPWANRTKVALVFPFPADYSTEFGHVNIIHG